jgi:hypothetical protein
MRVDPIVERLIGEYVVTMLLLKSLEHDSKQAAAGGVLKMGKVWAELLHVLALKAEREHVEVKRSLRFRQCKIVLQQYEPGPALHLMYVYRGYEYHCKWMIPLLKARCESKLRLWVQQVS